MDANRKVTNLGQLEKLAQRARANAEAIEKKLQGITVPAYAIKKQEAAESGYLATYYLEKDGEPAGEKINIPRDFLVKSAVLGTVTEADAPYEGAKAGDRYIDFVVNAKDGAGDESHVYLAVNELVDAYTGGKGITVGADNTVSVKVDAANANGLDVGSDGVGLHMATAERAGAMSAGDKAKLDGMEFATDAEVEIMLDGVFAAAEAGG